MRSHDSRSLGSLMMALGLVLGTAGMAVGQTDETAETTEPTTAPVAEEPPPIMIAPLIREGRFLVERPGTVGPDPKTGLWMYRLDAARPGATPRELVILPCAMLRAMQRVVEASPDHEVVFESTGQVFVYRQRNFFLPTKAFKLVGYEPRETTPPPAEVPIGARNADDVARQLQAAAGAANAARPADAGLAPVETDALQPEGHIINSRRGRVVRNEGGAWTFVFDADVTGLQDPPMILLPCLLLEEIEIHARGRDSAKPVLMTGQVFAYGGRNYLLPTVFRVPNERTLVTP